jgi:hypothetical protein
MFRHYVVICLCELIFKPPPVKDFVVSVEEVEAVADALAVVMLVVTAETMVLAVVIVTLGVVEVKVEVDVLVALNETKDLRYKSYNFKNILN